MMDEQTLPARRNTRGIGFTLIVLRSVQNIQRDWRDWRAGRPVFAGKAMFDE